MDSATQHRQQARDVLSGIGFDADAVSSFEQETLDRLVSAKFHLPGRLRAATCDGLKEAGLAPGDVCFVMAQVQGGGGGGGAAAAGTEAGMVSSAAASQLLTEVTCSNVVRLVDADETVGSCCLVSFNGRNFVLAARHCMNPKPGQRINVKSFAICGHRLRHLASFPKHDVTVLLLDDSAELPDVLRNVNPFEVDGGIGLMPGIAVTLIGFPLAADKTVVGFQQSGLPLVAPGLVCWLSKEADEAIGSYAGAFPNCSGGAVTFGRPPSRYLAGMHSGMMWHEHGTNPRDVTTTADQDDESGSSAAAAVTAAGGELVVETDRWSAGNGATGLAEQEPACGGGKRKPASWQEGRARDCAVQYCLNNVKHKSCMGTFVPAHVLVRLLSRCHELLAAAGDEDRGR
ncbi:hypothetical protein CHLRE_09g397100v5 [Chlamydomonas reinhardtii]|uniref:Uncharacterized protein n=1 Tax=Chlamydomonas reinhardtii TaxID=3055 RepID=A0A2K3DD48_CHLRE|nr:uncharacterized protein CHLRE_09g397100v5 [Chlamydomonas reinhardtii]PNW78443.1 hypothetical protein CHLRE_09g397100v5 [Chlamydomonas reinhardtii]